MIFLRGRPKEFSTLPCAILLLRRASWAGLKSRGSNALERDTMELSQVLNSAATLTEGV